MSVLKVLGQAEVEALHRATLRILGEVGVSLTHSGARQLLVELRPQRPAEHRRLWQLCLRTLRRPDAWIVSEESVARRHALTYFGHMAQVCGLGVAGVNDPMCMIV